MASTKSSLQARCWEKDQFFISTDPKLFPIQQLMQVFESSEFYWAKSLSPRLMQETLDNSLSFGLYKRSQSTSTTEATDSTSELEFIGIARCVTDFITFVYLTDVWVEPTQQGKGLGTWLVQCVQEVLVDMPDLRRSMLFTADWKRSVPFYQKLMGMELIESKRGEGLAVMESKGRGHPSYGREGTGY